MKFLTWGFIACMVFFLGVAEPPAFAQLEQQQNLQARQPAAPALRMGRYDKASEQVISGTIAAIQAQQAGAFPRGAYIVLRSGALTFNVHMGLFSAKAMPFAIGDQVKITGSLISVNGAQILLAREVQSDKQNLIVRSSNGFVLRPHPTGQVQGLQP